MEALTLKNIYRILMEKDYLFYSDGVISNKNKKGFTVHKFYTQYCYVGFYRGYFGDLITHQKGASHRYLSLLINNRLSNKYIDGFAQEISESINTHTLAFQLSLFVDFLVKCDADCNLFYKKLKQLDCSDFLRNLLENSNDDVYYCAYVLTIAILDTIYVNLPHRPYYNFAYEDIVAFLKWTNTDDVELMSNRNSLLFTTHRYRIYFFGRSKEMVDLSEFVRNDTAILLSGDEGIGKTEVLYHFRSRIIDEKMVDRVVLMSYQDSLAKTICRCMDSINNEDTAVDDFIALIEKDKTKKTLIVIDDVLEDKDLSRLTVLNCSILCTGRVKNLEGYLSYPLAPLSDESCLLLFRSISSTPITDEQKDYFNKTLIKYPNKNLSVLLPLWKEYLKQ